MTHNKPCLIPILFLQSDGLKQSWRNLTGRNGPLNWRLYFFVKNSFVDPRIKSELRYKIDDRFRESGITIPFPQRDVHLFNTSNPVYTPNTEKTDINVKP